MNDAEKADQEGTERRSTADRVAIDQNHPNAPQHQQVAADYVKRARNFVWRFVFRPLGFGIAWLDKHDGFVTALATVAIAGLTVSLLQWLVAFLSVGAEWFLMWQSKTWNGQEAAFRNFAVIGIVLLLVAQPDGDDRP